MTTPLQGPWALHPQVALRTEGFGALAYHFGTRRLSFLKSPRLREVVECLGEHESPEAACRAVGVESAQLDGYGTALARLAETGMIVPRGGGR